MFIDHTFLRIESADGFNETQISSIANCICPSCGGALSASLNQFRRQGRCGLIGGQSGIAFANLETPGRVW
jgi:hypothetical protein